MNDRTMRVNIATYYPKEDRVYGSMIWLPAFDEQIRDAKQQARAGIIDAIVTASILDCSFLPRIEYVQTLPTTVEELNYLAIRLNELNDMESIIYRGLFEKYCRGLDGENVSIKDLINMTFNLDNVIMVPGIRNDEDLGHFVMANDLHPDVSAIPESSLYLLDAKTIGKLQRLNEGGVVIDGNYVETNSYEMEDVYDGEHIPTAATDYVFRMEIASPDDNNDERKTMWITVPTDKDSLNQMVKEEFGVSRVEVCDLCDIETAIPQISAGVIKDLLHFNTINRLASRYLAMPDEEQIKFKAILSAENTRDLYKAYAALDELDHYELSYMDCDGGSFFKSYLLHHLPEDFDRHWLDTLITSNEGEVLMARLDAKLTEYGVLSSKDGHLFHLVNSFYLEEQGLMDSESALEDQEPTDETPHIEESEEIEEEMNNEKTYSIDIISTDDLREMENKEGLILQGCGGSLVEWIDGINKSLTEAGILLDGSEFKKCASFEHDGVTCLLFPFSDDVKLDVGKLAMWRLQTHGQFGSTWLSDYVPNKLGGFLHDKSQKREKPDCPLIGQNGNIFNLLGLASRTLRDNGMADEAKEMRDRAMSAGDYYKALGIIGEYVNITSVDEDIDEDMDEGMDLNL